MAIQWLDVLPFVSDNTDGTTVIVSGALNQSGYIYSVIVPAASGVPNADQIAAGQDSASGALGAGFTDSEEVSDSGVYASLSGYGLTSETDYTMYLVGSGYDDGLMESGWGVAFTTPDITAPTWISGYPALYSEYMPGDPTYSIYPTSGVYKLAIDCAGRGYALTLPSGSTVPLASAIKLSGTVVDMPTSGVEYHITKAGLTSNTPYTVYCVAEDTITLNLQSVGSSFSFTTLDITPPTWGAGYPSGVSTTTTTATFTVNLSEDSCEAYYAVTPSGMAPMSAANIKAMGTLISMPELTGIYTVVASGLNSDSSYQINVVGEDVFNNLQSTGVLIYCKTSDNIPPNWSGIYPVTKATYATSGVFSLALTSDNCSGFALALASGIPLPSGVKESGTAVDMASAGTVYDVGITGLTPNTTYNAYFIAQDEYANLQIMTSALRFSTDIAPPDWIANYPSVTSITTTSASAEMKFDDTCSGYGVVVLDSASTPSSAQIRQFKDAGGTTVSNGFQIYGTGASGVLISADILGLHYGKWYKLCAVGVDSGSNETSVETYSFRALVPRAGAPSSFYSAKNVAERRRKGLVRGTLG